MVGSRGSGNGAIWVGPFPRAAGLNPADPAPYATKPERSVACIEDTTAQKKRAYRVSEEISDGVKLLSVDRRRAVIDNRGSREQLSMEEGPAAGSIGPGLPDRGAGGG